MKSLFSQVSCRATRRFSLFGRYFALFLMVVLVFLAALTASMNQSFNVLQTAYIEQAQENFYQNCDSFSDELALTRSLISAVKYSEYYSMISFSDKPLKLPDYHYFSQVRLSFSNQCNLLSQVKEGFIHFGRSSVLLTTHRFFENVEDCFSSYLVYEGDISIPEILETLDSKINFLTVPVCNVSINGAMPMPYLTVLAADSGSQTYGFLYSADSILESFSIYSLPADTHFKMVSTTGEVLYSYNKEKASTSDYIEFSASVPTLSCTATIGIPQSYFDAITHDIQTAAHKIFLCSVLIGLVLCILLSYVSVKPFHTLIRKHNLAATESSNELTAIDSFLERTKQNNEVFRSMLLSSFLARTFYSLPVKENEYNSLALSFPLFEKTLQLVLIRDLNSAETQDSPAGMFDFLADRLPADTICESMNMSEVCIILQPEQLPLESLQRILLELNEQFKESPRFAGGVSTPFTGLHNLENAMRQAQFCLPDDGQRMIGLFAENSTASVETFTKSTIHLKQLLQALSSWNEKEVLHLIRRCIKNASQNLLEHPEEIFYSTLLLLRDAAQTSGMTLETYENITYQHTLTQEANLKILENAAKDLFRQKANLQVSETTHFYESIVQYIKDHFDDQTISLASLAEEFCMSERFTSKAILSVSGSNFSKILLTARMEEAARLLRETDRSIPEISERCGYPAISTFYRNFKGYYHKTPAEYKEAYSDRKMDKNHS